MMGEALSYLFDVHLREQIRHDAVAAPQDGAAAGPDGGQPATVAFADLVGFTRLGEMLEPEELGAVTGRLAELAADVVEPPVRLVKLLGDAAMLVGQEAAAVLEAAIALVEAAEREGEDYPLLRAGVAAGWAIPRGGRLVRAAGQPGEPDHLDRPAGKRAHRRERARGARGRLRVVVRGLEEAQGRGRGEAVPLPAGALAEA